MRTSMMMTVMIMLTFSILGSMDGITVSEFGEQGQLLRNFNGRHFIKKRQNLQASNEIPRSLEIEDFNIRVPPTSSKVSSPTMVKLYPPATKPLQLHVNLPLRFGRESDPGDNRLPKSTLNLPQRFGRSGSMIQTCSDCPRNEVVHSATLPQRFGRNTVHLRPFQNMAYYTGRRVDLLPRVQEYGFNFESEEQETAENL